MSEQNTFWISVDGYDGEANLSDDKPVSSEYDEPEGGQFWRFEYPSLLHRLGFISEGSAIFGVGRGQCAEFRLERVGEIIDGKTEVKG